MFDEGYLSQPVLVIKETYGPYVLPECTFSPVTALVQAGYPRDLLHTVHLDRHPVATFSSWKKKWLHRRPLEILWRNFVIATMNARSVEQSVSELGLAATTYVHELSSDPERAIGALFKRIKLDPLAPVGSLIHWGTKGQLDTPNAAFLQASEPKQFELPGLHGTHAAYQYEKRVDTPLEELIDPEIGEQLLTMWKNNVRKACVDLQL